MNISQRGTNINILKQIQEESKKISSSNGLADSMRIFPEAPKVDTSKLGAAASLGLKNKKAEFSPEIQKKINSMFGETSTGDSTQLVNVSGGVKFDFVKSTKDRVLDSIESLEYTKEYVSAIQSLFTLYAMDSLDSSVVNRMSKSDYGEILAILNEFIGILRGLS